MGTKNQITSDTTIEELCCGGKCRIGEMQQMTREQMLDALVNAEEELAMANAYIEELESSQAT